MPAFLGCLVLTLGLGQWLARLEAPLVAVPFQVQPLPAGAYRLVASGQLSTVVDALWITALQDPSYAPVAPGQKSSNAPLIELITELDPGHLANYLYAGIILGITRRDTVTAVDLLRKGDAFYRKETPAYWFRPWRVPFFLGWLLLFDLQELAEASQAFLRVARFPDVPEFIVRYAERGRTLEGTYNMGLRTLTTMIEQEKNPEQKKALERRKFRLFVTSYIHTLDERFRSFVIRQGGSKPFRLLWPRFLRAERVPLRDPWGGLLSLDARGRIQTTTPFDRSFSLKF